MGHQPLTHDGSLSSLSFPHLNTSATLNHSCSPALPAQYVAPKKPAARGGRGGARGGARGGRGGGRAVAPRKPSNIVYYDDDDDDDVRKKAPPSAPLAPRRL